MKRQKTKPFDFPAPEQGASIQLESASEETADFAAPLELREADSLGPMIPAEEAPREARSPSFE